MLIRLMTLLDWRIEARDGHIGRVRDFLFDDRTWAIRYLVADTGSWLTGKRVLIAPEGFAAAESDEGRFPVSLTREQVRTSPDAAEDLPVSRQWEAELHAYYGWTPYWVTFPVESGPIPFADARPERDPEALASVHERGDPDLRSLREISGYEFAGGNESVGRVIDALADRDQWIVHYLMVERTRSDGAITLFPPDWCQEVDRAGHRVVTELQAERVATAPAIDPAASVGEADEERIFAHYGRPRRPMEAAAPA